MEFDKKVIVDVDGVIETGKQFDLDLRLPEDERNVVYGIIRDHQGIPVQDAVVKLVEVCQDERKPVSHTFTDEEGEFVFGPLCPHKSYAIEIWVNRVKHIKICKVCNHEGKCLKGIDLHCEEDYIPGPKKRFEEEEEK
jgi:protocatechuate 3,4-dioxygenase beta subunit